MRRVVALGGGHGLAASLEALASTGAALTAVVTVADDGGSSGRLRTELGALPPGDLRMALAALAGPGADHQRWAALLQHRFSGDGPLGGHAVGNLLITGLVESLGIVRALEQVGELVGARGRVLPASVTPLDIVAEVSGLVDGDAGALTTVRGQVAVATTTGSVCALQLEPTDPPACPEAVQAVLDADVVVLGPGSWFTSVLTHLLVPELRAALVATTAARVVVLNLAAQVGETEGFSPVDHLEVLSAHAPDLRVDVVVADVSAVLDSRGVMDPELRSSLELAVQTAGGRLVLAPVAAADGTPRHDPARLAEVLGGLLDTPDLRVQEGTAWR